MASCRMAWWCASLEGDPCDCADGPLPAFLAAWRSEGLDVAQLPAWTGPRQFHRRMQTVELAGSWL